MYNYCMGWGSLRQNTHTVAQNTCQVATTNSDYNQSGLKKKLEWVSAYPREVAC